jgi:hypothetical protein
MGLFSSAAKDLRAHRDRGEELRLAGRLDDAAEAYREFVRELVAEGLRLRAAAACRVLLELKPGDLEARQTLHALTTRPADNITLEVQPADVVFTAPRTPPPLPDDALDTLETIDTLVEELRVVFAQSARILRDVPPHVATDVATAFTVRTLPAGTLLMRAGHAAPGVYAIARGEIALTGAPGGVRARVIGLGDVVGDTCTLAGNVASGDVVARTPTTALFLATRTLARLARQHPALGARLALLGVLRRAFYERLRPDFATSLD